MTFGFLKDFYFKLVSQVIAHQPNSPCVLFISFRFVYQMSTQASSRLWLA